MDLKQYKSLDIPKINAVQRNRYPMLFLDYVEDIEPGKVAKGHKNFTFDEWNIGGSKNVQRTIPASIQSEALEQMFLLTFLTLPENIGKKTATLQVDFTAQKEICIGTCLDIVALLNSCRRGLAKGKAEGYVNNELACSASFVVCIPEDMEQYRPQGNPMGK